MTFADLLTTLADRGALTASRVKDMKTSLRYLAAALGHATLDAGPVADTCRDPATWTAALEAHFAALTTQGKTIGGITRRNTRNNLRVLFRLAETHGLLTAPLPPRLLAKTQRGAFDRQQRATAPYQTTYRPKPGLHRFALPQAEWPPGIQEGWETYRAKCGLRIRETTFQSYVQCLTTYLGYLVNICGRTPVWDDLFDVAQLTAFVRWHAARLQRPISARARQIVIVAAAVAKVLGHPYARRLADFRNELPTPEPTHTKRLHMVSLGELEAVADACLAEGRIPLVPHGKTTQYPGTRRAIAFQRGVILKLLVRVPLRQRNVRELRLEKSLYKDQAGHWHLHFSGSDLKVGRRGGRVNTYHVDLTGDCPEFIPVLEEWLAVQRPKLPNATTSPFVFLTRGGQPYSMNSLCVELRSVVAQRTGKRFYPHLIRTIWATECLTDTRDYAFAATKLGDTLTVVQKTYYDIDEKAEHAKTPAFLDRALRRG